jgi:hypothetical protein
MAFVEESVEPGSFIHTDGWPGYDTAEKNQDALIAIKEHLDLSLPALLGMEPVHRVVE